ncbi:DNA helicase IV [Microlunatus sagamiharensis]|uniref:DNA helicase IV n=1 Tax=Microlunatus sagamiharensis TaxID=546874 RepID=A0A1H2LH50_9ACTN|nr:AAA family ATPase [Microlunatus sagamiharensis]SDU80134.1 DNA helicase IV [Microlunatus sagamiharensis]
MPAGQTAPTDHPPDPVLRAEQDHLLESRAALGRMRTTTAGLTAQGADRLATEHLKQVLHRRMLSLQDDPAVPLFFGRLDYAADLGAEHDETLYVGRRHITGEAGGEPLVIDWRAGMALPFYRARPADPMHVRRRRRFGFSTGALTAYEDEDLAGGAGASGTGSAILQAEIERPRTGPMRDIVATIQPEQDVIVRAGLDSSVCVQGAPGTGKTAVGLHRAAFLLYAYREQLGRSGVLVVGPNASFLSYIGDVLPALGEIDAAQATVESMLADATGLVVRATESAARARLKGDARLAEVVRRAAWGHLAPASGTLVLPRGIHQWRVPAYLADEVVAELRARGVRYEAGRAMLAQRLAHQVLLRMEAAGDSPDDRVQGAVARSREVKAYVSSLWPALDPAKLVLRLLTDADLLAAAADGLLSAEEQAELLASRPGKTPRTARWTLADLALVDEVTDVLSRTPSLGHVVLDEAQDLSPMMLRAVGRRASTGSMTVLGDLAQATTPWAVGAWDDALAHLGQPEAVVTELVEGFRVPGLVIDYAARLLPVIAPTLTPPRSVRHSAGELDLRRTDDPLAGLLAAVQADLAQEGTVGVVVPDARIAEVAAALGTSGVAYDLLGEAGDFGTDAAPRVDLVPATLVKGLEFDHVVLLEPAELVAAEADEVTGLRRLYVCLTRAVTSLVVVHTHDLPGALD